MQSRCIRTITVAAALGACACLAIAAPAHAAPQKAERSLRDSLSGMAKAEYEAGRILYGDKDYASALVKFQRAYELSKDVRLLWNMAVCEKNLRHYGAMIGLLERLLEEGGDSLTKKDRRDAAELMKTAKAFVSPMKIIVSEAGATVKIDGAVVGTSPLDKVIPLDVGPRRIVVSKPGFKDYEHTEKVNGGEDLELTVTLEKDVHRGRIAIAAGPEDLISIDGRMVGRGKWEGALSSGGHTLRVTAPEMDPYQSEVLVQDDQTRRIDVTLTRSSDGVPVWVWVAGGVALAAGAVIGGALLFQPGPEEQGTIRPGTVQLGGIR